jgi:hypothetical protein
MYHGSLDDIKKKCSSKNFSLTSVSFEPVGTSIIISMRTRNLFLLGVVNSISYSWRMTIQQENFPLIWCRLRNYCMGLESTTTLVVRSKI